MPLQLLQLRPGVNREGTTLSNEGGWYECDKIRFRSGYPQKIGGWSPLSEQTFEGVARSLINWVTLLGYNLVGVGTNSKYYIENGGTYNDVTPVRATSAAGDVTFAATNGSNIITVTDIDHGAITGAYVTFYNAVSLGGSITAAVLNNEFEISVLNSNTYTITVGASAGPSDTGNGGTATYAAYQINPGLEYFSALTGWGAGLWGGFSLGAATTQLNGGIDAVVTTIVVDTTSSFPASGLILIDEELITYTGVTSTSFTGCTRGTGGTTATSHLDNSSVRNALQSTGWGQSITVGGDQLRLWSEAVYGEYLITNPRNGALYMWVPDYNGTVLEFNNRAQQLYAPFLTQEDGYSILQEDGSYIIVEGPIYQPFQVDQDCPTVSAFVMVSDNSRFVISFGCNGYSTDPNPLQQDPMLIRWSDQESYAIWTPSPSNQAGSFRLSSGSEIVTAIQTRQEIIVLTDAAVYSMQYLGPPYVWGFNIMSNNISIAGPNAIAAANNIVYWMGVDKFYVYSGRVETLPCSLRQYVFGDINFEQSYQFFAGGNEGFSEIWWFYCSANSTTIDRYVIYNYLDQVWYYGTMERTAWEDSPLRPYPMATTYSNTIVYHESGVDDEEVSGQVLPITSYIQSSDFDVGDGHNYGMVWRVIPDLTFDGSTTPSPNYPTADFTIRPRRNPGSNYGPALSPEVEAAQSYAAQNVYTVQEFTEVVYTRVRGRQIAFKVSSDTVGTQWQLGVPRIDVRPDGRR